MIDALFKILNFGVFLGFVGYIWRRNLQKLFQAQIIRKKVKNEELVHDEYVVLLEEQELDVRAHDQRAFYKNLRQKMITWQENQERDTKAVKEMYGEYQSKLSDHIAREIQAYHDLTIRKMLVSKILKKTQEELAGLFEGKKRRASYTQSAIASFAQSNKEG